ncbi:phage tail tape measure protein [Streptomyces sp. NPDC003395]
MANWNLSVDLRGHGNDLAQALKSAAKNARSLGTAARTAKTEVRELGQASQAAARHIRTLGSAAQTAQRHINRLGDQANTTARRLNRYGDAARTANRNLTSLGDHSRTAGRDLARMSGQIDTAIRDLTRLAAAARTADARLNRVGGAGLTGIRRYREEAGRLSSAMRSMASLGAGLGLTLGLHEVIKEGNEYQQAMNAFGATTNATQMQMKRAAATAGQLGNDLQLPGATAADAAEAMVELAKAGFRTDQAISATRASLVLASAAQVNAADSAKYLGDMMDQFGMGADQAGKAADILAATANAASGDIIDIYYAMKYAGPVAHGLGVTMQEAAAGVGMLGKAGILGQTAGTTLRGMFANLASPTKQMKEGLSALGIEAWDAQGRFKGLRTVIDGLSKAQHEMTQQDFAAAVKKAFGKPAMSGAIALAHQGTASFDALMQAVDQTGAASQIAAAKGKGLAGAMLQLKTQARQTGLTIYQGMAPGLEFLTRGITSALSDATPKIEKFFDYLNSVGRLFGPDLAAAARREFGGIADAASGMADGFKDLGGEALANFLHVLINVGKAALDVLHNTVDAVEPVVGAFSDLSGQSSVASSAMNTVVYVLDLATSAVSALSKVLAPIGHVIAALVHAFGALPGPIQQFVIAAMLTSRIQPRMAALASTVSGRVTGAFRGLGEQMRVQQALAATAGMSLSRYGAALAVLQTRVPMIGRMGESFRTAAAAGSGFTGTLRGIGAASLTAGRALGSGLLGALGGPWGLAITAATVGLGYLATKQQQAAQAAAEHQQRISALSQALRESNGAVNDSVRAIVTENLMQTKIKTSLDGQQRLVDVARKAKIPMSQLVDAYTNQGTSLSKLQKELQGVTQAHKVWALDAETGIGSESWDVQGRAADDLRQSLGGLSGDFTKAAADAKSYNEGVKGASDGVSAYDRLKDAVGALADKTADADSRTRALKEALDLLSGGSVSLQAAQARVNEAITNANEAMKAGIDHADGWGKALIAANGTLDTTTKNGQSLFNTLNTIADGSANAAIAAYDFADSQGKSLPESLAAARGEMEKSRKAAIDLMGGYGLTAAQAAKVADSLGLIPGQVSILLQTQGVDSTLAELLAVQAQFQQMPKAKTIKVDALGEDAKKELEEIGYKIELIPGTREYKITASTKDARTQLDALVAKLSATPGSKTIRVDAATQKAIQELEAVKKKVAGTRGKTITINAPTAAARAQLEALGFKIQSTKGKTVVISVPTGTQQANVAALASAIASLHDKSVTIRTLEIREQRAVYSTVGRPTKGEGGVSKYADGGIVAHAADGLFVPGYAPRRDIVPAILSPGEGVLVPETVRKLGRATGLGEHGIIKALNAWGRYGSAMRFADGGVAGGVQRFASGGVSYTYTPTGTVRAIGDVQSAYSDAHQPIDKEDYDKAIRARANAVDTLRSAEARLAQVRRRRHTHAQLVAAETAVAKARRSLATATDRAKTAEARYKKQFSLSDWQRTLASTVSANASYEASLNRIAARGGADVIDQLRDMGAEGAAMVSALAKASNSQFNNIVANLRRLAPEAKATLADYTKQLKASTGLSQTFQNNLLKLASMGYGDLAAQLAGQGDETAMRIAASAVKDSKAAATANAAAKANAGLLDSDDLANALTVLGVLKGKSGAGIADILAAGIDWPTLKTLFPKIAGQVKALPAANRDTLIKQMAGQGVTAMARGGILTAPTVVLGGEAGVPESWIPQDGSPRSKALLAETAARMGFRLIPVHAASVTAARPSWMQQQIQHIDNRRTQNVTLNGAHQSLAEQRADLLRHMTAVG